ncbi:MAG: hypothetical protein Q8R39_00720 [bacterium]|nr:hypothetical protein [bacterium]
MQTVAQIGSSDLELMGGYLDLGYAPPERNLDTGVFSELRAAMRRESVLLVLEDNIAKEAIYRAYKQDLQLLQKYQQEFEALIQAAVRYAIIVNGSSSRQGRQRSQETWELLKTQIPGGQTALLIDLHHTRAGLPVPQLLEELKNEFRSGVSHILRSLAEWLRVLVANEFIGLVDWTDLDVCRYHYFKHEVTKEVVSERTRNETSFDGSKPYGSRTEYRTVRDREIHERQLRERHVHHIIRAKLHGIKEYPHRVPRNVAAFIDAIPASLQPHVHIVEGMITKEEVLRRQVGEERSVSSEILSVWKASPGVLFGYFNMIGWSGDDLKSGGVFYGLQKEAQRRASKQRAAARRNRLVGRLFTA